MGDALLMLDEWTDGNNRVAYGVRVADGWRTSHNWELWWLSRISVPGSPAKVHVSLGGAIKAIGATHP